MAPAPDFSNDRESYRHNTARRRDGRDRSRSRDRHPESKRTQRSMSPAHDRRRRRSSSPPRKRRAYEVDPREYNLGKNTQSESPSSRDRRDEESRRPHRSSHKSHHRSRSRSRHRRHRHDSRDRHRHSRRRSKESPSPPPRSPPRNTARSNKPLPSQNAAFTQTSSTSGALTIEPEKQIQKPNFSTSGLLAAETNTIQAGNSSIVLKYSAPAESRLPPPSQSWRLFVFKGEEVMQTLSLGERETWLMGREQAAADIWLEHPSCSKQHAVLQFRFTEKRAKDVDEWGGGGKKGAVRLYVLDLESANGTVLNGERIPGSRFVEVRSGDVVKVGDSTREYVAILAPKEEKKVANDG